MVSINVNTRLIVLTAAGPVWRRLRFNGVARVHPARSDEFRMKRRQKDIGSPGVPCPWRKCELRFGIQVQERSDLNANRVFRVPCESLRIKSEIGSRAKQRVSVGVIRRL